MTLLVETLVVALAGYRVWRLVGADTISEPIRDRLPEGLAHWVECGWCGGSWVTFGVTVVAWWLSWITSDPWFVALAAAAVVGLIGERSV